MSAKYCPIETAERTRYLWQHPMDLMLYLLTKESSVLVAGVYLADVLALQCETGLITHRREGDHLRVRRRERSE